MNTAVFILILLVSIRTFCFGISELHGKNISGGIAVFMLCVLTAGCAFYLMLRGT